MAGQTTCNFTPVSQLEGEQSDEGEQEGFTGRVDDPLPQQGFSEVALKANRLEKQTTAPIPRSSGAVFQWRALLVRLQVLPP